MSDHSKYMDSEIVYVTSRTNTTHPVLSAPNVLPIRQLMLSALEVASITKISKYTIVTSVYRPSNSSTGHASGRAIDAQIVENHWGKQRNVGELHSCALLAWIAWLVTGGIPENGPEVHANNNKKGFNHLHWQITASPRRTKTTWDPGTRKFTYTYRTYENSYRIAEYKSIIIPEVIIEKYNTIPDDLKARIRKEYAIVNTQMGGDPGNAPILYIGDDQAIARASEPVDQRPEVPITPVVAAAESPVKKEEQLAASQPETIKTRTVVPDTGSGPTRVANRTVAEAYGTIPEYQIQALRNIYRDIT